MESAPTQPNLPVTGQRVITVRLPAELHERLKCAYRAHMSMNKLATEALAVFASIAPAKPEAATETKPATENIQRGERC